MANISSINGNPIVPSSVEANSVTDAMLAQTGGVLDSIGRIDKSIDYLQSLTVDVVRPNITYQGTIFGVAFTKNADGSISLSGTATNAINRTIGAFIPEVGKTYVFETGKEQESAYYWYLQGINGTTTWERVGYTWTCTTENAINLRFYSDSGAAINETAYPVIRELDTNASLDERINTLNSSFVNSTLRDEIDTVHQSFKNISYGDDFVSTWVTAGLYSSTPMCFTKDTVLIVDGNIDTRVIMKSTPPVSGDTSAPVIVIWGWDTAEHVIMIPANMWFIISFRNLGSNTESALANIYAHSSIKFYDEYADAYIGAAIRDFESAIVTDIDQYPVRFGVITDAHYPSDGFGSLPSNRNQYDCSVYRREIENGCGALKRVASDLNLSFVVDLGDDAGYSTADNDVSNIIYCMTKMSSNLRGTIPAVCINGNHDAFQNNADVNADDVYSSRVVNQIGVTVVSNIATNYYRDDGYNKIRYVFFDTETRTDYTHDQAASYLTEMLSGAPSDYKFILVSHRDVMNSAGFNNARDYTEQITPYVNRILFHVTGHLHRDDSFTTGGLLNISFIAAGQFNYSQFSERNSYANTDKESSFAVVGYNPTANAVKVFGYGKASTRTFQL